MTTPSVGTLFAIDDLSTVETRITTALQTASFPVTDWEDGGIAKTLVAIEASENAQFSAQQAIIARGGYLSTAAQAGDDYLTVHAQEAFETIRYPATKTSGRVSLYCAAGAGPYTITVGQLRFSDAVGHRYSNTSAGTLASGGNLDLLVEAESAGSEWNVSNGAITILDTVLAGVSFAQVTGATTAGTAPPTVTLTKTTFVMGSQAHIWVKIIAGGVLGVATFQWSDNRGYTWSATLTTAATYTLATGLTLAFVAGTYSIDNRWYFVIEALSYNPGPGGSWITSSGTDEETNSRLEERCRNRWATLGYGQNSDWYQYYATNDHAYATEVTRVRVETMAPYTTAAGYTSNTPALTVSGAPVTASLQQFVAEITTGGARGAAIFKWSSNDGGTYTTGVTTAASCALGSTGCTISFADTTYITGQKWRFSGGYGGVLVTLATAAGIASAAIVESVQGSLAAKTSSLILVESAIAETVNIVAAVRANSTAQSTYTIDALTAVEALFAERDLGATLYLSQIIAALMGVSGAINVDITTPATTQVCGLRSILVLGTLTLNMTWVE
jgi:uncharacterized phage protein gp47/JayE